LTIRPLATTQARKADYVTAEERLRPTPFGITEFDTIRVRVITQTIILCSTPFGITEFDTL
jgi:hypothetical protein